MGVCLNSVELFAFHDFVSYHTDYQPTSRTMASLESGYKEQKTASEVLEPAPVESLEGTSEEIILDSYSGILGRLRYYEAVFDKKLGVEAHGPRRILPHEKKPPNTWVMFAMWGSSGVYTLGGLTLGFIGWEYGLGIKQTIPIMMFASLVGCAVAVSTYALTIFLRS